MLTQNSILYIKLFSILSGVRLVLLYLDILCAISVKGRIYGKETSSDADRRLVKTGMIVHLKGESSM